MAVVLAVLQLQPATNRAGARLPDPVDTPPTPTSSATPTAAPSPSTSHSPAPSKRPASAAPKRSTAGAQRSNCSTRPSSCGFPDATNTGVPAGTKLTVVDGGLSVTKPGTVVENKDIRGCVEVKAANVVIRRSKVTCTSFYGIASFSAEYSGGGLVVEDTEIDCQNHNSTAIGEYGVTARRLNIHGCENGFDIDNTITVSDSYIHDLYEGGTGHSDGVQLAGGAHIRITHNTIFNPKGTSAIISHPNANSDVLVSGNLLGGGAYTLYCPKESSSNFRVVGNRFSTLFGPKSGEFGPTSDCDKVAEMSGNVWDANLAPLS
jgi:hypothetical protein